MSDHTYRCALIGTPISHSLSPKIHANFAEQFDLDFEYKLLDTAAENVEKTILSFFAGGGRGLNITMPHKALAYGFCKQHSKISKITRTVNTLWMNGANDLCGDNTDATGFLRDLRHNQEFELRDKRVLVIGAGGAAQAVIPVMFAEKISSLYITNRSMEKAETLVNYYGAKRASTFNPESLPVCMALYPTYLKE